MKQLGVMMFLAAVFAVPSALAIEEVVIVVPEVTLHVDGARVEVPRSDAAPVQVVGAVEVKETDVSLAETSCRASTKLRVKGTIDERPQCTPGELSTDAPTEIVDYDVAIILPESAPPADEEKGTPLATKAAIAEAIPASPTVVLAAAAAGASAVGLYGLWRLLKATGLAALMPLYSHISDDEILEDPNRGAIYRLIQTEPGISTKDIADRLDLAWGTVTHHLGKLEKRRFVVSKKYGKYRRYFANGAGGTQDKDALAVLRLDRTGDVAELIRTSPGMTQKAVSQALGVSSSTILWHVKRLEEVNLVRKVREGKLVRYYPAEGMEGVALIPAATPTAA